jgi:hypothetical protein
MGLHPQQLKEVVDLIEEEEVVVEVAEVEVSCGRVTLIVLKRVPTKIKVDVTRVDRRVITVETALRMQCRRFRNLRLLRQLEKPVACTGNHRDP